MIPRLLSAVPVYGEVALACGGRLTPVGHDEINHLDMGIGPVPLDGLRAEFEQFRRELA